MLLTRKIVRNNANHVDITIVTIGLETVAAENLQTIIVGERFLAIFLKPFPHNLV